MKSRYVFNNEALASIVFGYILARYGRIETSKSLLILPFVFHEPTLRNLNSASNKRSIEEFIAHYPSSIIEFNSRFLACLPLAINSIVILEMANVITITKSNLLFNLNSKFFPENTGSRAGRIFRGVDKLMPLIGEETNSSLYLKLKVQL